MSLRPRSTARAALLLRIALGAVGAASTASAAASCTQSFGALIDDGGAFGESCTPGAVAGSCEAREGCGACANGRCELTCDVCGATCSPFACTESSCVAHCTAGTSCEVDCPERGAECTVSCVGCAAHIRGSAANHTVNCDQRATCSLSPLEEQTGETVLTCTSGSSCAARSSGDRFKASCSGQSTCIIDCGAVGESPGCDVDCNDTSVCRMKCPADGKPCKLSCGGRSLVDCGGGWIACAKDQCPA